MDFFNILGHCWFDLRHLLKIISTSTRYFPFQSCLFRNYQQFFFSLSFALSFAENSFRFFRFGRSLKMFFFVVVVCFWVIVSTTLLWSLPWFFRDSFPSWFFFLWNSLYLFCKKCFSSSMDSLWKWGNEPQAETFRGSLNDISDWLPVCLSVGGSVCLSFASFLFIGTMNRIWDCDETADDVTRAMSLRGRRRSHPSSRDYCDVTGDVLGHSTQVLLAAAVSFAECLPAPSVASFVKSFVKSLVSPWLGLCWCIFTGFIWAFTGCQQKLSAPFSRACLLDGQWSRRLDSLCWCFSFRWFPPSSSLTIK